MSRKCSICANGNLKQVNKALQKGMGFRAISRQLIKNDSMRGTIRHHAGVCLGLEMRAVIEQNRINGAIDVHKEFIEQLEFAKKLRVAAQNWLTIVDVISLESRSEELDVVYLDYNDMDENGKPAKKTDDLDTLLERIEHKGYTSIKVVGKRVDLRSFALDSIKTCDIILDKFAKIGGDYQADKTNDADHAKELQFQIKSNIADAVIRELQSKIDSLPDEYRLRFEGLDVENSYQEFIARVTEMDEDELRNAGLPFSEAELRLLRA